MSFDPAVGAILKKYEMPNDAVWQHKQSGSYIMKHWACEHVALKAGIAFDEPVIVQADAGNKLAVLLVTGHMGDHYEWSFGEAAPYNTQQSYPFAMAEKRAKDRVILKLLGVHGKVYSEEEADDFQEPRAERPGDNVRAAVDSPAQAPKHENKTGLTITALKKSAHLYVSEIHACEDMDSLIALQTDKTFKNGVNLLKQGYPDGYQSVIDAGSSRKTVLTEQTPLDAG